MRAAARARELFTAAQVTVFCSVDLETIHNRAESGELRRFRTQGRHLRFRRSDVVEFLDRFGYPIPGALIVGRRRVHVLDDDGALLATVKRKLAKNFEVTIFRDPFDALVAIGIDVPDGIVLDVKADMFDGVHCLARLKQLAAMHDIPFVVCCGKAALGKTALEAGASTVVVKPDVDRLGEVIEGLVGRDG